MLTGTGRFPAHMSHAQHVPQSVSTLQPRDCGPVGMPIHHLADSERTGWTLRGTAEQIPHLLSLSSQHPLSDEERQRQENKLQGFGVFAASSFASKCSRIRLWWFSSPARWKPPTRIPLFGCSESFLYTCNFLSFSPNCRVVFPRAVSAHKPIDALPNDGEEQQPSSIT